MRWTELEDLPDEPPEQIERMWQRLPDGLVLSLEQLTRTKYQLVTLPENFHQDNQVIDKIGEYDKLKKAEQKAEEYMEENQ